MTDWEELAAIGSATIYEAAGRQGLVDETLVQVDAEKEREKRAALQAGALSYDLDDRRALVEGR